MSKQWYEIKAFTLTELLMVIIIVSIIAAAATPSYRKYMLKSRVNSMYEAANAAKFVVTHDYYNQGSFPNYASNATAFTTSKSAYISSISIANGTITITGAATKLYDNAINLTIQPTADPQKQITWQCCVSSTTFFDYVPQECQYDMTSCSGIIGEIPEPV